MKCVNCKNCIGYDEINEFYICNVTGDMELIEECIANNEEMDCDFYEQDCNDDFAA